MFKLEKAKSGDITLIYNSKYIHSKYNPRREAENFAKGNYNTILKNKINVLYGVGLGYHIKAVSDLMSINSMTYVFEYNIELINYCKKINPEVFKLPNINIIDAKNENFYNLLSEKISLANGIIIHRPSLDTIREVNSKLFNLINDFNTITQLSKLNTINSDISEENKIYNSSKNYSLITELLVKFRKYKKPFLIVSAGPSIDCQMELLSKYKDKFVIICVGSALKTLMNNNIIPNAIVIIDPKEIVKKQIDGYENLNVPLCFPASASRWAIDKYNGNKYIFGNLNQDDLIKVGGTVAISAIDIAIKSNAKEIVFIGQDLAYFDENSHTSAYKEIYGFSDEEKKHRIVKKAKSVYGNLIGTCDGYLIFKRKIEQLISKYEYVKFINCSCGLEIEGTEFIEFEEYLDKSF